MSDIKNNKKTVGFHLKPIFFFKTKYLLELTQSAPT